MISFPLKFRVILCENLVPLVTKKQRMKCYCWNETYHTYRSLPRYKRIFPLCHGKSQMRYKQLCTAQLLCDINLRICSAHLSFVRVYWTYFSLCVIGVEGCGKSFGPAPSCRVQYWSSGMYRYRRRLALEIVGEWELWGNDWENKQSFVIIQFELKSVQQRSPITACSLAWRENIICW